MATIKCHICGAHYKQISNSHLKKAHGITLQQYREQFPDAPIVSPEVLNKISYKNKGRPRSEEHKKKLSESIRKGYENGRQANRGMEGRTDSPETTEKKRLARTGKKHSEETKAKIGAGNRGKKMTPEQVAKQQASLRKSIEKNGGGFSTGPRSEDFKRKMSEIAQNRDPELVQQKVEQMWDARRGQVENEETREKKRIARLEWMEQNEGRIPKHMFNTKPELDFKEVLDSMGVEYIFQFHSKQPHYLYDFFIENKIIIEIDGPYHYWERMHPSKEKFDKMKLRDAKKNMNAINKGWAIFRIKVENNLPDDWAEQLETQGLKIEAGRFVLPASKASK